MFMVSAGDSVVEEGLRKMVMTLPEVPPSSSTSLPLHLAFPPSSPSSLDKMASGETDSTHYHQVGEPPPYLWIAQTFSESTLYTPTISKLHFPAVITQHYTDLLHLIHLLCHATKLALQFIWTLLKSLYISVCVCVCV